MTHCARDTVAGECAVFCEHRLRARLVTGESRVVASVRRRISHEVTEIWFPRQRRSRWNLGRIAAMVNMKLALAHRLVAAITKVIDRGRLDHVVKHSLSLALTEKRQW